KNPVGIVVPCHRVIAANGGLGGYAWGLEAKQQLLDHERDAVAREI
ncbi:MAG: methylated-DNA--[protein]-cysteine S-methyltransferase, partial [Acidimicrobiia bacterium]